MSQSAPIRPAADRNLLFAVLALQLDFLSQNALIGGLNAWVLDKAKPLGDILVQRGALRRDAQAVLEALVEKHLELHQGDPDKSLASLRTQAPLRLAVGQITDPQVQASLSGLDQESPPTVPPAPENATPSVGLPTSAGQRFRILRPHARGGLGEVFLAQDEELQREVALKEIQGRWADHAPSRARFLLEAAITGGLEHPGIVPVYGLGAYPDGRPYYAMRFIKGDSLKTALRRFHDADQGKREPGQRTLELRQLLSRFVAVCNAVAYAHSRGVLHRDLKPDNVMLGPYGETLLVDWGLAKTVGRPQGAQDQAEQSLRPESASDSAPTQAGAVLGTPSYMSPEQAAGRVAELGPASDVYSLGATLYVLLTGKAPFEGNDVGTLLQRVQRGDFALPRQVKKEVPAALEAICLKAMALHPADRYASARTLAEDVERWLAEEPVNAFREPWTIRAGRWLRRHRIAVTSAAAGLLVAAIAALIASVLLADLNQHLDAANADLQTNNERLDTANRDLKSSNVQLELARKDAEQKRQQAEDEKQIAQAVRTFLQRDLLQQADPTNQADRLLALGEKRFQTVENPTIKELLDRAAAELTPEKIEQKFPRQPLVQAEILQTVGNSYRGVGDYARAVAHLERSRSLYEKMLGREHPTTLTSMNNLATGYQDAGKQNLALPLFEETLKLTKAKLGPAHPSTLTAMNNLALGYQDAGKLDLALPLYEETLKLRKAQLGPDHPNTLTSMNNLAYGYQAVGKQNLALPLYQETLKLKKAQLGPDHPDTLLSMNNLADTYRAAGKLDLALPLFEETLKLRKAQLGPDHPSTLTSMNNLAEGYRAAGKLDLALPLFEETLKLRKAQLGPDHPNTLLSMNNLAYAYRAAGKLDLALPLFEETLKLRKAQLGPDHPDTLLSMNNLAAAYLDAQQPAKALPLARDFVAGQRRRLGANDPRFTGLLAGVSLHLLKARQFSESESMLRECFASRAKTLPDDWRTFNTKAMLGAALLGQKKYAEAEALLLAGYQGMREREAKIPAPGKARLTEAEGHLAELFEATRQKDESKLQGKLTDTKTEAIHEVQLTASKPVVIDMRSARFDTYLRLEDAKGKTLAENNDSDAAGKNLNSRIVFLPVADGVYRIVATSVQQAGRGDYQITVRQYSRVKPE